jgi:two-component sensor histidine kinase
VTRQQREILSLSKVNLPGSLRHQAAAHQLDNSLETLSSLLYLLRRSFKDPAKANTYLDIVDKVLIDIAANRPLSR